MDQLALPSAFPITQTRIKPDQTPAWEENLEISKTLRLKTTVSLTKISKKITWVYTTKNDVTITVSPERSLFAKVHQLKNGAYNRARKLPIKFHREDVEICGVFSLDKEIFDKTIRRGRRWIARLNHELKGRKKHLQAYAPGGSLENYVFCTVKAKHVDLMRYLTLLTAPLYLWEMIKRGTNILSDIVLSESDFRRCHKVSPGYEHKIPPAALTSVCSNASFTAHMQQHICSLSAKSLFQLTYQAYYIANYKGNPTVNYVSFEGAPPWTYVCNKSPYKNCGALGLILASGRLSQVYNTELLKGFFPNFVLKTNDPEKKFTSPFDSTIEINAFECEWAKIIIRHNRNVLGISPIVSLRKTLVEIEGVIWLDSTFACECKSCQEVRKFVLDSRSLTNLCAEVVKRNILLGRQNPADIEECVRPKVYVE